MEAIELAKSYYYEGYRPQRINYGERRYFLHRNRPVSTIEVDSSVYLAISAFIEGKHEN